MKRFRQRMPKKSLDAAGLVVERIDDGNLTLDDFVDDLCD